MLPSSFRRILLTPIAVLAVTGLATQAAQEPGQDETLFKNFAWRAIGPVNGGGRVTDIEVADRDSAIVYVGAATGGVWKTINHGTTWQPVFDKAPCIGVSDIAVSPTNPDIVWVGTGEVNTRQSVSYGCGIFKSVDAGKSWSLMGLDDSGHIGRIAIDPKDPNIVYVAVAGNVFKPSETRGLYKTTDGGKTWTKSKGLDADTGFVDVQMDPSDSRTLLAASYQRRRTAWGFNGSGPGSGLWKTTDAGRTWRLVTAGLGETTNLGRIGLTFFRRDPRIVYAIVEKGPPREGGLQTQPNPNTPDPARSGIWRSDDRGDTWRIISNNNQRPMYFSLIRVDPENAEVVYAVADSKIAKSTDGGRSFNVIGQPAGRRAPPHGFRIIDPHALWIDPRNPRHLMLGHDGGVQFSWDGGDTWEFQDKMPLGQFYGVGVDMRQPYYVYGGAQDTGVWGGPSGVRNVNGITKAHWFQLIIGPGDGMRAQVDPTDWATVYIGVFPGGAYTVGNLWRFDLRTAERTLIRPMGPAGSGDPDPVVLPIGVGTTTGPANIVPPPPQGETYRFNWNSPFILSPHNPHVIYYGGNKLFRSLDRGRTWTATADLTKQIDRDTLPIMGVPGRAPMASKHDGVAFYGMIVSIAESPLVPGLLWAGTDDGNLQVSQDGGSTWKELSASVARFDANYYVQSIEASHFDAGTAYVAFDGHWAGDFRPHLFKTADYGQTWSKISNNLPELGHINVVKEDPSNPRLLYVGTETGFFVSIDGGRRWTKFMNNLPATIADDVVIHPRDTDLVLATHGRSFFVLDDTTPLQQLSDEVLGRDAHLFDPRPGVLWREDRSANNGGGLSIFRADNPPDGTFISYYLRRTASGNPTIEIVDALGNVIRNLAAPNEAGINRVLWDLRSNLTPQQAALTAKRDARLESERILGDPVPPGRYIVRLTIEGRTLNAQVRVEPDPNQ